MPSATTMQASLPDWMMMPCSNSSSRTLLWIGIIIAEVPDGPPPRRHAPSLTTNSSVTLMLPSLRARNSTASVISLLMLAGYIDSSAATWNRTAPESASIR